MIDRELLAILICPACGEGHALTPDPGRKLLLCPSCRRGYPVRQGIPVMLIDEAVRDAAAEPPADVRAVRSSS